MGRGALLGFFLALVEINSCEHFCQVLRTLKLSGSMTMGGRNSIASDPENLSRWVLRCDAILLLRRSQVLFPSFSFYVFDGLEKRKQVIEPGRFRRRKAMLEVALGRCV